MKTKEWIDSGKRSEALLTGAAYIQKIHSFLKVSSSTEPEPTSQMLDFFLASRAHDKRESRRQEMLDALLHVEEDYDEDGELSGEFRGEEAGGGWRSALLFSIRGQLALVGANVVFFAILSSIAALDWHDSKAGIRFK